MRMGRWLRDIRETLKVQKTEALRKRHQGKEQRAEKKKLSDFIQSGNQSAVIGAVQGSSVDELASLPRSALQRACSIVPGAVFRTSHNRKQLATNLLSCAKRLSASGRSHGESTSLPTQLTDGSPSSCSDPVVPCTGGGTSQIVAFTQPLLLCRVMYCTLNVFATSAQFSTDGHDYVIDVSSSLLSAPDFPRAIGNNSLQLYFPTTFSLKERRTLENYV